MAKTTIALTPRANTAAASLDGFNLPEMIDLVRLGFAYAVTHDFSIDRPNDFGVPGGAGNYTASTATLDQDRKIAELVTALYHEADEPYLAVETLANKGLIAIAEALKKGEIGAIADLLPSNPVS